MIIRFFLVAAALSTISSQAMAAHTDFSAGSPQATLNQVFQEFKITDLSKPEILTFVDLQTLTLENMNRIAKAIEDNHPLRGFPECMKSDTYDTRDWISDELKKIVMIPASFKGDHH